MEISHLVVAGCSWTYCQGLDDPKTQGWPALVAKELNVPVVNLAKPGIGNDAIHRRTYEYAFEDLHNNNNPLYIICWTQTWRREAWCRQLYNKGEKNGYYAVAFPHKDKPLNNLERATLDTWDEEDFYRKLMLHRLSLDSLFKSKNIPYYSSFFAEEEYNNGYNNCEEIIADVKERFSNTISYLSSNSNRLHDFFRIAAPYPKLPCGHEGVDGNKAIAEYLLSILEKNTSINKPYLSLKEYAQKTDKYDLFTSHWL